MRITCEWVVADLTFRCPEDAVIGIVGSFPGGTIREVYCQAHYECVVGILDSCLETMSVGEFLVREIHDS